MEKYLIPPGSNVKLDKLDASDTSEYPDGKKEAQEELLRLNEKLEALQEMLYAQHKHKVLIILQGMDTGGKDGVIRHVFEGVNPQGVKVASFKAPTPIELDHDYLWRVHSQAPGNGEIVIFNRSHYEDVLVVRVHDIVPEKIWRRRYAQINHFEEMLFEEGVTILKFFLFISPDEQKGRLLARLQDPTKQWKFNPGDLKERKFWNQYIKAYEEMLERTSTKHAPWYVIPADKKWYRNLVIARIMIQTLEGLRLSYPKLEYDLQAALATFEEDTSIE